MLKPILLIVALYFIWRVLSTFGRSRPVRSRRFRHRADNTADETEYRDLTKQEISDADFEEIKNDQE